MTIRETTSFLHWNYFLALESDVDRLGRFVEFASSNFGTYSIEMVRLLLAAGSEVDVIAKLLCSRMDESASPGKIDEYRHVLRSKLPDIESATVTIPRYGLTLQPWDNWRNDETPDWWHSHNYVKHERNEHFGDANLQNVLNAMAGLFLLVLYFYRETGVRRMDPAPILFEPPPTLAVIGASCDAGIALFIREGAR